MSTWTDELKAQAEEEYLSRNPTPENSVEIVNEIAEEMGQTPNGVRLILTKAGVYIKKAAPAGKSGGSSGGGTRVSKEDAHNQLTAAIEATGQEVDGDIISKLTGKAAVYLAGVISKS